MSAENQSSKPPGIVIESVVMPGGWHKPEKDRLGQDLPEPIRADTYKKLIEAVVQFRLDNSIPLGDVKAEVDEYICTTFPHMCHYIENARVVITVGKPPPNRRPSLTDDIIQWFVRVLKDHSIDKLVTPDVAKQRAEICRKCKLNIRWNESCGSCVETINRSSALVRFGQDVPHGKELKGCQVLRHENRSAVWLKDEFLESDDSLPSYCWARKK